MSEAKQWLVAGASVQGTLHKKLGKMCDDFFDYTYTENGDLLIALSDGAGSAKCGSGGAQFVVRNFLNLIQETLSEDHILPQNHDEWHNMLVTIVTTIHGQLLDKAQQENSELRDYACTLLAILLLDDQCVVLNIGDGLVVGQPSRNENFVALNQPQRGEYANSTFFVTDKDSSETFEISILNDQFATLIATTDGLLNIATTRENAINYVPFQPFFRPFARLVTEHTRVETIEGQLIKFLDSNRVNKVTDDDKTLVIATIQK